MQIGATLNHWRHSEFMVSDFKWTLSAAWQSFSISLVIFLSFSAVAIADFNLLLNLLPLFSQQIDDFIPTSQGIYKPSKRRTTSAFFYHLYPYLSLKLSFLVSLRLQVSSV